jgi:hypothetical protein
MVRRAELYGGALAGEDVGGRTQRARSRRSTTARGEGGMARGARGGRARRRGWGLRRSTEVASLFFFLSSNPGRIGLSYFFYPMKSIILLNTSPMISYY